VIFGLHNTTLANWIVVAIDSEFSAVLKEASHGWSCLRFTAVQIPNVTWMVKEQVTADTLEGNWRERKSQNALGSNSKFLSPCEKIKIKKRLSFA